MRKRNDLPNNPNRTDILVRFYEGKWMSEPYRYVEKVKAIRELLDKEAMDKIIKTRAIAQMNKSKETIRVDTIILLFGAPITIEITYDETK